MERLKGAVKRYDRPTDPVWDEYLGSGDSIGEDFMDTQLLFGAIPEELFSNPQAFIGAVKAGIPGAWLASAVDVSGYIDVFSAALQLPAEKMELLFNEQCLDSRTSEIILDTVRLLWLYESVWESSELATRWLSNSVAALGDVEPVELVNTFEGRRWVSKVLSKIEQGQFS